MGGLGRGRPGQPSDRQTHANYRNESRFHGPTSQ
jgi:hypothetical protein